MMRMKLFITQPALSVTPSVVIPSRLPVMSTLPPRYFITPSHSVVTSISERDTSMLNDVTSHCCVVAKGSTLSACPVPSSSTSVPSSQNKSPTLSPEGIAEVSSLIAATLYQPSPLPTPPPTRSSRSSPPTLPSSAVPNVTVTNSPSLPTNLSLAISGLLSISDDNVYTLM